MSPRFLWVGATAFVLMCGSEGTAAAQVITGLNPNVNNTANPPTVKPSGTYSVGQTGTWQVVWTYGSVANGTFTAGAGANAASGTIPITLPAMMPFNGSFAAAATTNLPAVLLPNSAIQAQLQIAVAGGGWANQGNATVVVFAAAAPPP